MKRAARSPGRVVARTATKPSLVSDSENEACGVVTSPWTSTCGLAKQGQSLESVRCVASCPSYAEVDLPSENATTQCASGHCRSVYRSRLCHARHPLDLVRDLHVRSHHRIHLAVLRDPRPPRPLCINPCPVERKGKQMINRNPCSTQNNWRCDLKDLSV